MDNHFTLKSTPHCPIRPLWLQQQELSNISLLAKKINEWGFNAIVIDSTQTSPSLCKEWQRQGIKVILKLPPILGCPLTKTYKERTKNYFHDLLSQNPFVDFLFWESSWQHPEFTNHPDADIYTLPELLVKEVSHLEKIIDSRFRLIFYLPTDSELAAIQSSKWISFIINHLNNKTLLSFSAVAGSFLFDHLPPHPFLDQLNSSSSSPPLLLPIVNIGTAWPILTHDLLEEDRLPLQNPLFAGLICTTSQLPTSEQIQECNFWVAAQMMHNPHLSASSYVKTWLQANKPDWNYHFLAPIFHRMRLLTQQVRTKNKNNSITSQITEIEALFEKEKKKQLKGNEKIPLEQEFSAFASEIKKALMD